MRLLLVLLLATRAFADAPAVSDEARNEAATRFERGVKLFDAQDYTAALAEFEAANRLAPRYQMMFNIGVCEKRLFRYNDAVRALKRYLDEGGERVPPDRREQVERELAEIRALVAEVTVQVGGLPASIEVDGRVWGETPLGGPLYVASGHHVLRAVREGDEAAEKSIDVISGEKLEVALAPRPRPKSPTSAIVTLSSHPEGAELRLDGKKLGVSPWSGSIEPGGHQIDAVLIGYYKSRQQLLVIAGQTRSMAFDLERVPPWYKRWYVWTTAIVVVGGVVVAGVEGYNQTHDRGHLTNVPWPK